LIEIAPKAVSTFGQGRPICSAVTSKVEQLGEIAAVFGAMETIAMRTKDLAVIVTMAVAAGAGIAYSVKKERGYYCPQPSAASVATLFAPCLAFESAMGHRVTKQEAVMMGLLTPAEPTSPATQLAAKEHATVGVAH
jgi:hypothetical protein